MATNTDDRTQAKEIVNARVAPSLIKKLEALAASMKPTPSKSQLIELAIEEFIESRTKGKAK